MNYKEYEYSFEVNDLKPIIDFCINNNYTYEGENQQTRVIYKDKNKKFMFRTTENNNNGVISKQFDFKENKLEPGQILGERQETLEINYDNSEQVESIVAFFGMHKESVLIRKRMVYVSENVKFELDEYTSPRHGLVVGIEGQKEEVDKIFQQLKQYRI